MPIAGRRNKDEGAGANNKIKLKNILKKKGRRTCVEDGWQEGTTAATKCAPH